MNATENFLLFITDNMKKIFFPEEWLELDLKLSKTELFSLLFLSRKEQTTMTELAEAIGVPMSTATGLADRLVRQQYVKRERNEEDRRIVVLVLTDQGDDLVSHFKDVVSEYIGMVMESLSEEEQQIMMRIALKIFHNLQRRKEIAQGDMKEEKKLKRIEIE